MNDTSHYNECAELLLKFKNGYMKRLIATGVALLINFYMQTYVFAMKYTGESIASVMYANDGKAVSPVGGLLSIGFTAIAFVVGLLIFRHSKSNKLKFGYVAGVTTFMGIVTIINHVNSAKNVQGAGVGVSHLAFGMGVLTLLLSLGLLAAVFFSDIEHPKRIFIVLGLTLIGTIAGAFNPIISIPVGLMFVLAVPLYSKAEWLTQQEGYPYFNERFRQQQEYAEYKPLHKLDHRSYAEMIDIDEGNAQQDLNKEKERQHREKQRIERGEHMTYTLHQNADSAEMPSIDDIREVTEPLPEPELPDVDAIPDPVWNTPEPQDLPEADPLSGFPETRWDMPEANWDVPDVAADIPDLPDIPDIPQI
ncbi:MAG: hypothetical protein II916_07300 [Oscillospiraceae bacterium]|nr:hypothetical protein [Oscillospiraceae bacterium]